MKPLLLALILFVLSSTCLAQSQNDHSYKKAKIYLENHRIIKVNNLEIEGSEVSFMNSVNRKQEKIAMNNIKLIRVPKGSYLLEGALYGAGTGALTAVLIDVQNDDPLGLSVEKKRGAGFYIGWTAGGAVVGALVGSLFPKWKQVYADGKFIGLNLPVNLQFNTQNDRFNIKIGISI